MRLTKYFIFFILVTVSIAAPAQQSPYHYTSQKKIECRKGAVVSAHPLASEVGLAILKQGGNAFDAAIATQLALAVVYPCAGNIGGGGFMLAYLNNGQTLALDYREKAPSSATRDMYLDKDGNAQTNLSQKGHLASGVPGTIAGLFAAHKYAKLPFRILIQPAINLAENGFVITKDEAELLNKYQELFQKYNTRPTVFLKAVGWKAGDTLIQTELAQTLKRIRDFGQKGFYEGTTALLITEEMKRGGGILTLKDLKEYKPITRVAMKSIYKGYTILGMPLESSGGILIQQMMGMLDQRTIAPYGFHSWQAVQLMVEIERRAFADRAQFLGDRDFVKVPVKSLTSPAYLRQRMADYDPEKAGNSSLVTHGQIPPESEETTHLSIIDQWGNAVAVTTTINDNYGSKTVVGGAGFLLNNEMDDFSIKPGVPNMYGAVGGDANAIAPGKRMLSSMTPTIVLKNNKPYLIVGTPGGTTIITSVFQTLVNILEFHLTAEEAVNKPKFHHQWLPDLIYVEPDFPMPVRAKLTEMGYKVEERKPIGRVELIQITNGKITAIGDKRGDDHAAGY